MQCLWLERGRLRLREAPRPVPAEGEALIRVRLAGICRTDQELVRGYYPFTGVPGHEFVGDVVSAPADPGWVGRRVVGEINAGCRTCPACLAGRSTHCDQRTVLGIVQRHGAFAEYLTLPLDNLHRVPGTTPDEVAVFTEPLAAACEILEQVPIRPPDRVLLVGAGRLGQLIARRLQLTGCRLEVVARYPGQRDALSALGIHCVDPSGIEPCSMDLVVEAGGSPEGFMLARQAIRPRGTLVLKSTYRGRLEVDMSALVVDEITLIGSRCGPFSAALPLLERGEVDPAPLIETCYPLSEGVKAFEHAGRCGAFKVLLKPPHDAQE